MKKTNKCELSIVTPMFNEEDNIENTLTRIKETMKGVSFEWEIILVNDGSTDNSLNVAEKLSASMNNLKIISYTPNMGRGRAIRQGLEAASGEFVVTIDFDLSYAPEYILKIYSELKNNELLDIVLASPYMPGGATENVPPFRLFVSRVGNIVVRQVFSQPFHTVTSIMRGYRKRAVKALSLESNGKEIHLEILSKALALGMNIKEIPAVLSSRKKGKSKFKFAKTSINHLMFSLFERPIYIFMSVGLLLLVTGFILGLYITYLRIMGNLNIRPLIDLVVLSVIVGIQFISFGILAGQNSVLRKEIYKLQSSIKQGFQSNKKYDE